MVAKAMSGPRDVPGEKKARRAKAAGAKVETKNKPAPNTLNRSLRKAKAVQQTSKAKQAEIAQKASEPAPNILGSPVKPVQENPVRSLAAMRLNQTYTDAAVRKVYKLIPIERPKPEAYVRCHPGEGFTQMPVALVEWGKPRKTYWLTPEMAALVEGKYTEVALFTTIDLQDDIVIWPVKLNKPGRNPSDFNTSALLVAEEAKTRWLSVICGAKNYTGEEPKAHFPPPNWPELTPDQLFFDIAFPGDRVVRSVNHPVMQSLLGYAR
jgi:hypothetical protein